jgi:hypothetical protein
MLVEHQREEKERARRLAILRSPKKLVTINARRVAVRNACPTAKKRGMVPQFTTGIRGAVRPSARGAALTPRLSSGSRRRPSGSRRYKKRRRNRRLTYEQKKPSRLTRGKIGNDEDEERVIFLSNSHQGRLLFVHADLHRLPRAQEWSTGQP